MKADRIRTYTSDDWAVQRWDRFNGGKPKLPQSFCQFWRTVLLWATLASIPLIGKMFQQHLYVAPPPSPLDPRIVAVGRGIAGGAKLGGRSAWMIAWPLRLVLGSIWNAVSRAAAWIDERDDVQRKIGYVFNALVILVASAAGVMLLVLFGIWFTQAWQADWRLFVIGCESVALVAGGAVWGRERIVTGMIATGEATLGFFSLIWEIAVVSHHRICPSMEIFRAS